MLRLRICNKLEIQGADPELKEYLRELLTMENPEWLDAVTFDRWTGNIPKYVSQYSEENDRVVVPTGILIHLVEDLGREWEITDERVAPRSENLWPEGNVILRPGDQEPAVEELLSFENGYLSAPAGAGKTVMGLEVARRLGLKALWLTHRKDLKDQVIDRAEELFELPRDQIGVLHGKTWRLGDQLTVGMIPTLRKRDLTQVAREFGVVLVDEAHHVPSTTFLHVIDAFWARYLYGLTATAYRRDKLDAVMFNTVGPIVSKIDHAELFEEEHLMKPTIRIRHTGWNPLNSHKMDYHDFMEAMPLERSRNEKIVRDIVSECVPGNIFFALVERTKHAEILTEMLKEQGIRCEFVVSSVDVDTTPEERVGRRKRKKRTIPDAVRAKIIADLREGALQGLVTTYSMLKEGFDYKPLNRMFLVSPMKWRGAVAQAIGRIQRPCEGKDDAIVWDYVDERIGMFTRQAESRLIRVYEYMELPVEQPL